ncbi:MAG: DUF2938 family protein [Gemmatimonadetes bacterium]|nr:DUF2938 family protein [Gemmatimonadota bacterium]
MSTVMIVVVIGVGATLCIDLWTTGLRVALGVRSLDYCLLGRWIRHMPGRFVHADIAAAAARTHECPTGWAAHYAIGVSLAGGFIALVGTRWLAAPSVLPALAFGVVTVVIPWFVMHPALGMGIASARTRAPTRARLKSLGTHLVYGVGLYLAATIAAMR